MKPNAKPLPDLPWRASSKISATPAIDTGLRINARTYWFKLMHPLLERRNRFRLHGLQQRRYFVMPGDWVSDFTTQFGTFEPEEIHIARYLCQQAFGVEHMARSAMVDVGCHIGNYSVELGPQFGMVVALDAVSSFAHVTRANLAWNGLADKSHVLCMAAAARAGRVELKLDRTGNLGHTHVVEHHKNLSASGTDSAELVEAIDLDSLLKRMEVGRVSFIKIDVEGGEVEALAGAARTIEQDQPLIQVEVDRGNLASVVASVQHPGASYTAWRLVRGHPIRRSLPARVLTILLTGGNRVYLQRLDPARGNTRNLPCVLLIPDSLDMVLRDIFPITTR